MNQTKCSLKFFEAILFMILGLCVGFPAAYAQDNPNTITFENQSGEPALVKLIGPTGKTVEVPDEQSRTVNVAAGAYYILIRYGSEPEKYNYAKGDPFTVTQTATQYSDITITLHKVIGGKYQTSPSTAEEFEKAVVTIQDKVVSEKESVFRIFSVPIGLEVYISPSGANNLTEDKYFKGTTPLSVTLEKGNYSVVVMAPLAKWQELEKFHTIGFSRSFQITDEEQRIGTQFFNELNDIFENDGNVRDKDSPMVIKGSIGGEPVRQTFKVEKIGKIYDIVIPTKEKNTLISLFQRKKKPLHDLITHLPESTNFHFNNETFERILNHLRVDSQDIPVLIDILHRGGKVVIWTDDVDDAYFEENGIPISLFHMAGYKKYKAILEALGDDRFELIISLYKK